jgi:hypothetical protein
MRGTKDRRILIETGTSSCRCCQRSLEDCLTRSLRRHVCLLYSQFHTGKGEEGGEERGGEKERSRGKAGDRGVRK